MDFLKLCENRYSARAFDRDRSIPPEKMDLILEAARLAPTGCNAQQWKVLLLESPDSLRQAEECSDCVYDAPAVLLFCYDRTHPDSTVEINHVNVGLMNCTIAATHAILEATEQGINSCWVCWFEEEKVRSLFHLPDNWDPTCMLMLGYDVKGASERHGIRKPIEQLVERR